MSIFSRVFHDIKSIWSAKSRKRIYNLSSANGSIRFPIDFLTQDDKMKIVQDADLIANGYYQIYNYQLYILSDWNTDPISHRTIFPSVCKTLINTSRLYNSIDVKNYWEQAHLHGVVTLAQAYAITEQERYADKCVEIMLDWERNNFVGTTISWKCSMDIAIRLVNMVLAITFIVSSESYKNKCLTLIRSISEHIDYIKNNLENKSEFPNNHYITNIIGIVWGSFFLMKAYNSEYFKNKTDEALQLLDNELSRQIYTGGFDYENSVYYHCFVSELISETVNMLIINGHNVSDKVIEISQKMLGVCDLLGVFKNRKIPLIGDQDGSRLLFLKGFFNIDRCDFSVLDRFPRTKGNLTDSGIYLIQKGDFTIYFKCGSIGTSGKGTHDHNDQLSVCIYFRDKQLVIDGGTFAYTNDITKRNLYRSENKHSTIIPPNFSQNDITHDLFSVLSLGSSMLKSKLPFYGTFKYNSGEETSRKILFEDNYIVLIDEWTGKEKCISQLVTPYTLDSWIKIDDKNIILKTVEDEFLFSSSNSLFIREEEFSEAYGCETKGSIIYTEFYSNSKIRIGVVH